MMYGLFMSMILYPVFACWVWGGGWLSQLGVNFGLGNGHMDFAGSSVVHMTGGLTALAGAIVLGPRIGKYNKDGSANAIPGHNIPFVVVGTLILAFGGSASTPAAPWPAPTGAWRAWRPARCWRRPRAAAPRFSTCGRYLVSLIRRWVATDCSPAWSRSRLPAFVSPTGAVIIGAVAGVLVVWSVLFVERVLKVDDPVGAVSVHGVCGAFGCLAIGLFADGKYGAAGMALPTRLRSAFSMAVGSSSSWPRRSAC